MKRIVLLAVLAAVFAAVAGAAAAQECRIEYQRADNAMSAAGRPDGALGTETLTLKPGETKVFNTDWKFEKRRNDGSNYYGSHVRIMRNTGSLPVRLSLKGTEALSGLFGAATTVAGKATGGLNAGQSATNLRHDLEEVTCPGSKQAKSGGTATPGGTPNAPQPAMPPEGLAARQASPDTIVLNWQPDPTNAREYRVYVDPPPQPQLAGKPSVVGGNGGQFVISVRNVAQGTVYNASIETVGKDGSISSRIPFPSVQVDVAGSAALRGGPTSGPTSGGTNSLPSTSTSSSGSGQQCPPGQFVTGISGAGKIVCAPK